MRFRRYKPYEPKWSKFEIDVIKKAMEIYEYERQKGKR